jgi:hypothetical protein
VTEKEELAASAEKEREEAESEEGQEVEIEKLELEMSKKMLLRASTLRRAEEVGLLGTVKE